MYCMEFIAQQTKDWGEKLTFLRKKSHFFIKFVYNFFSNPTIEKFQLEKSFAITCSIIEEHYLTHIHTHIGNIVFFYPPPPPLCRRPTWGDLTEMLHISKQRFFNIAIWKKLFSKGGELFPLFLILEKCPYLSWMKRYEKVRVPS